MPTPLDPFAADVAPPAMYGCTRDQVHARRMVALRRFLSALAFYARGKKVTAEHHLIECQGALLRASYEAEMCAREEEERLDAQLLPDEQIASLAEHGPTEVRVWPRAAGGGWSWEVYRNGRRTGLGNDFFKPLDNAELRELARRMMDGVPGARWVLAEDIKVKRLKEAPVAPAPAVQERSC